MKTSFNETFESVYSTLADTGISEKELNSIKGRLFAERKHVLKMTDKILKVKNVKDINKIFNTINESKKSIVVVTKRRRSKLDLISLFPVKYHEMFNVIVKNARNNELHNIKELIGNYVLAIESQKRVEDLQKAKTVEEATDILNRVALVSKANNWADLAPSRIRSSVKKRLEEFADILVSFDNYDAYKTMFMIKAATFKTSEDFFTSFVKFVNGTKDGMDKVIAKIDKTPGIVIEKILENQIIAWVYCKNASIELGSSSWCISYKSNNYFDSYVYNDMRKQYFIWDFDHDTTNNNFQIGITLHDNGTVRDAHLKNDDSCKSNVTNKKWFKELTTLKSDQQITWLKYIKATGRKIPNWKMGLLLSVEMEDKKLFSDIVKDNYKAIYSNRELSQSIFRMLIDSDNLEFIKVLTSFNTTSTVSIAGFGKSFIYSHDNNKKEIFKFFKSLLNDNVISIVKKISNKHNELKKIVEYYNKEI